jgi:hypothetical protein
VLVQLALVGGQRLDEQIERDAQDLRELASVFLLFGKLRIIVRIDIVGFVAPRYDAPAQERMEAGGHGRVVVIFMVPSQHGVVGVGASRQHIEAEQIAPGIAEGKELRQNAPPSVHVVQQVLQAEELAGAEVGILKGEVESGKGIREVNQPVSRQAVQVVLYRTHGVTPCPGALIWPPRNMLRCSLRRACFLRSMRAC